MTFLAINWWFFFFPRSIIDLKDVSFSQSYLFGTEVLQFCLFFITSILNHWFFMSTTSCYKENTFLPQLLLISPSNWLICSSCSCILSANHPYLQPEGCIAKGAAQRDRPNACERRFWLPPSDHQWSRSTAAKPDVLTCVKARPQHREPHALLLTNSVWVL